MNEQIKSDWDYLYNSTEVVLRDSPPPIFSPTSALAYAEGLARCQDEDAATTYRMMHPSQSKSFYAAARFAIPYLILQTNEVLGITQIQPAQLVTLAAGVAKFLQTLKAQYGHTIYEEPA